MCSVLINSNVFRYIHSRPLKLVPMSNQLKNETFELHKSLGFFSIRQMRGMPHMQQFPLDKMVYLQVSRFYK